MSAYDQDDVIIKRRLGHPTQMITPASTLARQAGIRFT